MLALNSNSVQADPAEPEAIDVYQNASFQVNFRTAGSPGDCPTPDGTVGALQAWPAEAQTAMNHVVDIIDNLVNSDVTIVVDACYQPDSTQGSLAFASATDSYDIAVPASNNQPVSHAAALTNAIDKMDTNGANRSEIFTSVNTNISWDFCTTNCTVANDKFDFVSTLVHEILHGMGFAMSFGVDNPNNPSSGNYEVGITDVFVYSYDGTNNVDRLVDLNNNSADLLNAFLAGSGKVVFDGPNTKAANDGKPAFIYSINPWEDGSSMSHLDDNHPDNKGRMMNAATGEGPSSRVIDAITLAFLKDIGWSVNDAQDLSDGTTYPLAGHIADVNMVNHIRLGATVNTESSPATNDSSDDGVTKVGTWTTGTDGGTIQISVQVGTSGAKGCFNAWADWNNDNDFEDADEQLFSMVPVDATSNQASFDIPGSVDPETEHTYRFRLHQDWDNDGDCDDQVPVSSTVRLMNGEVEDYVLPAGPPPVLDKFIYLPLVVR